MASLLPLLPEAQRQAALYVTPWLAQEALLRPLSEDEIINAKMTSLSYAIKTKSDWEKAQNTYGSVSLENTKDVHNKLKAARDALLACNIARKALALTSISQGRNPEQAERLGWGCLESYMGKIAVGTSELPHKNSLILPFDEVATKYRSVTKQGFDPANNFLTLVGLSVTMMADIAEQKSSNLLVPTPGEYENSFTRWQYVPTPVKA